MKSGCGHVGCLDADYFENNNDPVPIRPSPFIFSLFIFFLLSKSIRHMAPVKKITKKKKKSNPFADEEDDLLELKESEEDPKGERNAQGQRVEGKLSPRYSKPRNQASTLEFLYSERLTWLYRRYRYRRLTHVTLRAREGRATGFGSRVSKGRVKAPFS